MLRMGSFNGTPQQSLIRNGTERDGLIQDDDQRHHKEEFDKEKRRQFILIKMLITGYS